MAYVPQFIQTDPSVLQSTLNQYQQAYDLETNRQNQANDTYAAMPTGQVDAVDKNEVMSNFAKAREELDKKYNYDRANSQYAKELASKITDLRSNPLWSHLKDKEELNKMRQQLIATKGADYHENFDPNSITIKERNKLQEWKPVDLKDVRESSGLWAKEVAKNIGRQEISYPSAGVVQFNNYIGYDDTTQAAQYLNEKEGSDMLKQSIISRGFDPNDPKIYQEAYMSALSNLVGGVKIDRQNDPEYQLRAAIAKKNASSGSDNTGSKLTEVGTSSDIVIPFPVTTEKEVKEIGKGLKTIDAQIASETDPIKKNILKDQKIQMEEKFDSVNSVVQKYRTDETGKKVMEEGTNLIKSYFPSIKKEDAAKINERLVDLQVETGTTVKNPIMGSIADAGEFFLNRLSNLGGIKGILGSIVNPGLSSLPTAIQSSKEINAENNNSKVFTDLAAGVYQQAIEGGDGRAKAMQKSMRFLDDIDNFFKGEGNFVGKGYNIVQDKINSDLEAGVSPIMKKYSLTTTELKPEERNAIKELFVSNIDNFSFIDVKKGSDVGNADLKDANKLKDIFKNPDSEIKFHIDNEGLMLFELNDPKTNTNKILKVDPAKSSYDILEKLADATGDNRIISQMFASLNIAPKKGGYNLSGDDNYVQRQLGQFFRDENNKPDITAFEGYKIEQSTDKSGATVYNVYTPENGKTPVPFPNKIKLLEGLANVRAAHNQTIKDAQERMFESNKGTKVDLGNSKDVNEYIEKIGMHESGGNYSIINLRDGKKEPALGLYQFLPSTIKSLGFNVSNDEFLKNKPLQDEVMRAFIANNIKTISNYGYKIDPKNLTTEAIALLAAAHYGGPGAAKALINKNPRLHKKNIEMKWNTKTGVEEEVKYPSVIEYLQTSMGIDSTKLNFNQSKS